MAEIVVPEIGLAPTVAPAAGVEPIVVAAPPTLTPVPAAPAPVAAAPTPTPPSPATEAGVPIPPGTPAPAVSPEMQQYIASLEQERQAAREREDMRGLEEVVTKYSQRLQEEQGFTPEQADYVAKRERDQAAREYQAHTLRQGQLNAAFEIGQHYGVDPRSLMNLPTPQAMVQTATWAKAQGSAASEIVRLKAENEALKRGAVPATTYAAPGVSATPAPGSYIERLKSGGPLPSAADIDRYTAQYMTGSR